MKNIINISANTNIKANGVHTNGNCKAVLCTDNGKVYTSIMDAAMDIGATPCNMSNCVRGKQKTCKGKHFVFLSKANECLPQMAERLSEMETLRAKASAYDKLMLEQKAKEEAEAKRQEALRKAKEDHAKAIEKAQAKISLYEAEVERRKAKLKLAEDKLMAAQIELEALMDKEV
jgi:hypothetical protein